jgi:hypothetical protein
MLAQDLLESWIPALSWSWYTAAITLAAIPSTAREKRDDRTHGGRHYLSRSELIDTRNAHDLQRSGDRDPGP